MKMPYVVGVNAKSPQNPHHGGAHGSKTNDLKQPKKTTNIIYGAVIGGPDVEDKFVDDRTQFNFTEVALDYNAAWQGLMAFQVMNLKTDETNNNNTNNNNPDDANDNNDTDYPTDTNDTNDPNNPNNNNNSNDADKSNAEEQTKLQKANDTKTVAIIAGTILAIIILLVLISWKRAKVTNWIRNRFGEQNDKFTRLP